MLNKQTLEINIRKVAALLNNLLISPEISKWKKNGESKFIRRKETDLTNLFQPRLMTVFKHVHAIYIKIDETANPENIYTISLMALLSLIEGTVVKKVDIKLGWRQNYGKSWIETLWFLHAKEIRAEYKEKGYHIEYDFFTRSNLIRIKKL